MGKKVISTTTAALEGHSNPNHMTAIGATPTSGMALVSEATGSRPRCKNGMRSIATATAKPSPQPSAQPINTALPTVCTKSPHSLGAWSAMEPNINEGAGSRTRGTSRARTSTSQKNTTHRPNRPAVSMPAQRFSTAAMRTTLNTATAKATAMPSQNKVLFIHHPYDAIPGARPRPRWRSASNPTKPTSPGPTRSARFARSRSR